MASGGTQYVDELQEIESTIAVIKEKIEELHNSGKIKGHSSKVKVHHFWAHGEPLTLTIHCDYYNQRN